MLSQALIVLLAWLSMAPVVHGGLDDPDCDPAVVVHDASQHRVVPSRAGSDNTPLGDHCLACHFFRLSRHGAVWRFVPQAIDRQALGSQSQPTLLSVVAVLPLPARAPPVQI
jgi:hypothetical protein